MLCVTLMILAIHLVRNMTNLTLTITRFLIFLQEIYF